MGDKEKIGCQINYFLISHFYKKVDNKVIEFLQFLTDSTILNDLTFNNLTDLTHLITFFLLILLHTVSKIGIYGLLYIRVYSL